MKKSIILTAIALLISAGITAQSNVQTQDQKKIQNKDQNQEQSGTMTQTQTKNKTAVKEGKEKKVKTKTKKANHGQAVSETARNTESGEGKGEIVSEQAKLQGETQQSQMKVQTSAKKQTANKGARPANSMQQNKVNAAKGTGAGRK